MSSLGIYNVSNMRNDYSISQTKLGMPNYEKIPHKGMTRPAETEFDTIIDELAKGLATAHFNKNDSEYRNIRSMAEEKALVQYISVVSPDRKALAKDAMQLFNKPRSSPQKNVDTAKTLIDYLNLRDGMVKKTNEGRFSVTMNSGVMVVTGSDLDPNTFELKCSEYGQSVLTYNRHGWSYTLTPQEQTMQQSFLVRLNSAEDKYYGQLIGSATQANNQIGNSDLMEENSRIDLKA